MNPNQPILKVVPVPIEEDWQAPEGYAMRELLSVANGDKAQFFAVLMILPKQEEPKIETPAKRKIIT